MQLKKLNLRNVKIYTIHKRKLFFKTRRVFQKEKNISKSFLWDIDEHNNTNKIEKMYPKEMTRREFFLIVVFFYITRRNIDKDEKPKTELSKRKKT